ncbi:MAG TPA: efflux RND transporter permease subunit [Burkholderiales bacterium]|nr:efflux RND transporter permease subunit [Burkholderiales bacterium]
MNFYRALIANHPLANITFLVVLLLGIASYAAMPREQDPEINFNWVQITTVLPGASPEDVEKRVTKPLEDAIKGVPDIKFVMSSSRENISSILVRFRDVDERVFDKRVNDLRREIQNEAQSELPREADDPLVLEVTTSNGFPTAQVLVTGQADDEALRSLSREIRDDLERIPGVDRVFALGLHDPELLVEFSPQAARARGLTGADIADGVGAWFRDTFAGTARSGDAEWLVRMIGTDADPDYLARLTLSPAGRPTAQIPLESVASAQRAREKPAQLVSHLGRPGVLLSVTKKSYTNTLDLVAQINDYIARKNSLTGPAGVTISLMDDQTVPTREAIRVMESNAVIGLALVLAVCWIFLGTRISALVALGIPFSLAGTFALLHALGYTLNISVLLGIVIVLGMLVDDAVVVVEAIYYRMQRGQAVVEATLESLREVTGPVVASVTTTIAAFLPLMLLPGIVGKFMFVIPFIVTLALAISLIEAFWILPAHVNTLRLDYGSPARIQRLRSHFTHLLRVKYSRALIRVMRRPRLSAAVFVLLVAGAGGAVATGLVRVQFFAFDPLRIFYVNVDMPAGAPLEGTLARLLQVEERVRQGLKPGEARAVAAVAGAKFTDTEPLYGDAYGQVIVALNPRLDDMRETPEIVEGMREAVESTPGPGKITFTQLSGGPPVQKPIRVRVRADDYTELRAAADAIRAAVQRIPGTRDVADDDLPGRPQLVLNLDREAVKNAGLDPARVARLLRLHVDGEIVAEMRDRGEKLEVRVRAEREPVPDIALILDDPIALPGGGSTTLAALTTQETGAGRGVIKHYNLRRAITVEADLDKERINPVQANRVIQEEWEKLRAQYPRTDLDFSGELDDIQESLDAMPVLFLLGVGFIYLILAAQFRSYFQPLMILVTVPLAFAGVVYGLLVSRNPLSLYTLYGVIALTGIAVNSAIVLIAAANERLRSGMGVLHCAVYAARRRVVPIIITAVTTIAGLFSLAFGIGGKSLVWGPVAASIVWGLAVSTLLTLFAVPLLYWTFMRGESGKQSWPWWRGRAG